MADQTKIVALVTDKIQKSLPFSAWSITTEMRKQQIQGSHDVVKDIVHLLFKQGQMQSYLRESCPIPGKTNKCWVYYPPTLDPQDQAFKDYVFNNGPEAALTAAGGLSPSAAASLQQIMNTMPPGTVGQNLAGQVFIPNPTPNPAPASPPIDPLA